MRVLYASEGFTTHDRRICETLVQDGAEVWHLRMSRKVLDHRPASQVGYRSLAWRPADLMKLLVFRPDVILAGPIPTVLFPVVLLNQLLRRPCVAMSWGSDILLEVERSWSARIRGRFALNRCQAAFCDCQAVFSRLIVLSRLSAREILCFPWGIDVQAFSPGPSGLSIQLRERWGDAAQILVSTRSWEPIYSIETLLRAFHTTLQVQPRARLLLLGDGSLAESLQDLIEKLQLEHAVYRPGRLHNEALVDCFRAADVYVSTALSDGSSISLLEAMGCGLPAIVPEVGGNPEWVEAGRNGWLYPAADAGALASAMLDALRMDDSTRARWGEVSRERVLAEADWSLNSPRLPQLLRKYAFG